MTTDDDLADAIRGLGLAVERCELPQRTESRRVIVDGRTVALGAARSLAKQGCQIVAIVDDEDQIGEWLAVVAQVVERDRLATRLAASLDRLRTAADENLRLALVVHSVFDAVLTVDEDGIIQVFNASAEELFRIPAAEAIGTHFERFIPREAHEIHRHHVEGLAELASGFRRMTQRTHVNAVRNDGLRFPVEVSISRAMVDERPLMTAIVRDMTADLENARERERLEAELRQSQKLEALGRLSGAVAHDFNNFLAAIVGYTELARDSIGVHSPASDDLHHVLQAARRGQELVASLLRLGGTGAAPDAEEQARVDLRRVAAEAVGLVRVSLPDNVELSTRLADEAPTIQGNARELTQVLVNLCTNAIHAVGTTGGRLEIVLDVVDVDRESLGRRRLQGACPRLRVIDDGDGMDRSTRECMFDPFFTTKAPGKGTGLGLAVVRSVVSNHSGAIDVETAPGEGTTIGLTFPPLDVAANGLEARRPNQGRSMRDLEVLFVDDEPLLTRVASRVLGSLGCLVMTTNDPAEALETVRADPSRFAVLFTDLNMPGVTGPELARRASALAPELVIVVMTGDPSQLPHNLNALGIQRVLHKPFSLDTLVECLREVV